MCQLYSIIYTCTVHKKCTCYYCILNPNPDDQGVLSVYSCVTIKKLKYTIHVHMYLWIYKNNVDVQCTVCINKNENV